MALNIINPTLFYEIFGKSKFDENKDYSLEQLTKMTVNSGKELIKSLLIFDLAYGKLVDYYAKICEREQGLFNIYKQSECLDEHYKDLWVEYLFVNQEKMKKLLSVIDEKLKLLEKKDSIKSVSLRAKLIDLKSQIIFYANLNISAIKQSAYEKYTKDCESFAKSYVAIANLYRHIKEYCRVKKMFVKTDCSSGMSKNRANIFALLQELESDDFNAFKKVKIMQRTDSKGTKTNLSDDVKDMEVSFENEYQDFLKVKKLFEAIKEGTTTLSNKGATKKGEVSTLPVEEIIADLDNAYLIKIKFVEDYLQQYYEFWIKYHDTKVKPDGVYEVENKKKYASLSQIPQIFKNYTQFFENLDSEFSRYKISDSRTFEFIPQVECRDNKFALFLEKFRDTYISILPELIDRDYYDSQVVPFVKAEDSLEYTVEDFHFNTPAITDAISLDEARKSPDGIKKLMTETGNVDELENLRTESDIKNMPLDKKIDLYFENLIGLDEVKETILEIISKKILLGKNYQQGKMHMAFLGNPGTGKTTVARILGNILYENRLIDCNKVVEVKFSDLYQRYVGASAQETAKFIKQAEGGILFIDEAHQFYSSKEGNDFRDEIINTLIPALENNNKLLVIFAGYSSEMMELLTESDKGLFSRVSHRINFKNFSKEEIMKIFDLEMKLRKNRNDEHFVVDKDARRFVSNYFDLLLSVRKNDFSNGREVRVVVEKILNKFAVISLNSKDIKTITAETMKQILTSDSFKKDLISGCCDLDFENKWEKFCKSLKESESTNFEDLVIINPEIIPHTCEK